VLRWLGRRSTAEILVLTVTVTICIGLIFSGGALIVYEFVNPGVDSRAAAQLLAGVVNTLIGLVAGFLAGRVDQAGNGSKNQPPSDTDTEA
jgi:hypothetical protein